MADEVNNLIAIFDMIDGGMKSVEEIADVVWASPLTLNPPADWTANLMPIEDACDEFQNDLGANAGWDQGVGNTPVPVLILHTMTAGIELAVAGAGRMKECMRIQAAVVGMLETLPWTDVCYRMKVEGTVWGYPDPGVSTRFTSCVIHLSVEWFSGRGDLSHQPV